MVVEVDGDLERAPQQAHAVVIAIQRQAGLAGTRRGVEGGVDLLDLPLEGTARVFRANVFERGKRGLVPGFKRGEVAIDGANDQSVDTYNIAGTLTWDFGPVSFISVTSLWKGDATSVGDVDGGFGASFLPPALTGPGVIPFTAETRDSIPNLSQFTQEFRLASNGDGPLSYQGGLFFFDEGLTITSANFSTLGDPLNAPGGVNIFVRQRQDSPGGCT